ncbi:flagellar motor protein MotB [Planctomycetota bacterium]
MKRTKKQTGSDDAPGAPEWMVTFSDCMTLLLTFFVLLLSFSSFDSRVFPDLKIIYSEALTRITPTPRKNQRDALSYIPPIQHVTKLDKGSETPTSAKELKNALMEEAGFVDLQGGMVFLVPSKKVFWGKGTAMSREGGYVINLLASFLQRVPGRVVISETGSADKSNGASFGLPRAWVIMNYFVAKQGLNKDRFSISATGIVARDSSESKIEESEQRAVERIVEITLLERNTYN